VSQKIVEIKSALGPADALFPKTSISMYISTYEYNTFSGTLLNMEKEKKERLQSADVIGHLELIHKELRERYVIIVLRGSF